MIDFRSFHKLSYGLYIISSAHEGRMSGYAGNTGFQVTSEPMTIAVSCNKNNFTCGIIEKSKAFSLSVLQKDLDVSLIGDFGFKTTQNFDKFTKCQYKTGTLGIPVVTGSCIATFECKVISELDCGSHVLFIGEVVEAEKLNDNPPLTYDYYHEHYKMLAPKNAPTYIDPEKLAEEKPGKPTEEKTAGAPPAEHICIICGYTYDPELGDPDKGIPPGTPFEDLPDDYTCPICSAGKDFFKEI
jgi:flavin reductase (DIM6/NTAB) family NADH-FMN oxidoreductase RutF/rubredoxin